MKTIYLILIALSVMFFSCKSSPQTEEVQEPAPVEELEEAPMEEQETQISIENLDWDNFSTGQSRITGLLERDDAGSYAIVVNPESRSNEVHAIMNSEDFDLEELLGQELTATVEILEGSGRFVKKVNLIEIESSR